VRTEQREKDEAARLAARKKQLEAEATAGLRFKEFGEQHPEGSTAAKKFLASIEITQDMWRDGEGYDLEALDEIPESECEAIEGILISHKPRDWRDIEALAQFDSSPSRKAIEAALRHSNPKLRREATRHVPEKVKPTKRRALLIKTLNTKGWYDGLSEAIDEVEEFHPRDGMRRDADQCG
jgi:hypothetical protein